MNEAKIMATIIVAMLYFRGNFCLVNRFLYDGKYITRMLSKNRFNRCLHGIADLFLTLILHLGETWKKLKEESIYGIDSFLILFAIIIGFEVRKYITVKIGETIFRAKGATYMVYHSHFGSDQVELVRFFSAPRAFSDISVLALYNFDLSEYAWIVRDKAYNN